MWLRHVMVVSWELANIWNCSEHESKETSGSIKNKLEMFEDIYKEWKVQASTPTPTRGAILCLSVSLSLALTQTLSTQSLHACTVNCRLLAHLFTDRTKTTRDVDMQRSPDNRQKEHNTTTESKTVF